jgi:hypothetical protein
MDIDEYMIKLTNYSNYIKTNNMKIKKGPTNKNDKVTIDRLIKENELYENKINEINQLLAEYNQTSDKIVLDIETDKDQNILQIAYNIYDKNNNLLQSKDFYVYDGIHSDPFYPTINKQDIIEKGISLEEASNMVTQDINNTNILIGHNIKNFDLVHINRLNSKFNNKIKDNIIVHDTMTESKNIVKATNKLGRIKNPKLEEMLIFLCNKKVENYHNATGDITATFECYKILCEKYNCFTR